MSFFEELIYKLLFPLAFIKFSFYHFQQLLPEDIIMLYQAYAFYCVVGKIIACKICWIVIWVLGAINRRSVYEGGI